MNGCLSHAFISGSASSADLDCKLKISPQKRSYGRVCAMGVYSGFTADSLLTVYLLKVGPTEIRS